ncbi:group II truncated hemoglobin [Fulvimonas sp. R45]|uniref:group II truncated hemoglobin n=1 Tax=Fulvimonas sp. R45 TaxID=3045937 RepID=UPI00265E1AE7|nr:group II truncated hemoglobin [Fulvimonas sp. R45]MDO1529601.1 group II truncated hemoglobin [Fulvimonas sp. R45]
MSDDSIPSLYEWAGGLPALERLTEVFYRRVPDDPLLAPLFAHMDARHPHFVALFLAEVFGGPPVYTRERGGHHAMLSRHVGRHLDEAQRARWMALLLECADAAGLPDDPEFRSAFVGYVEWGTRLALLNSRLDVPPDGHAPMPAWGWGETGGPYRG